MNTTVDTAKDQRRVRVKNPHPQDPCPRLAQAHTIDDVIANLDQIIEWAIKTHSTIGYFAVLYKRSTVAIREALNRRLFDKPEQMERFDVVFAQRYFDALNAYFYPGDFGDLNLAWEVAFVGQNNPKTTILQQMLAGLNAHICFDLGIAAVTVKPESLADLQPDFDSITDLVGTQVPGMLDVFERLSPGFRWVRRLTPEVWLINRALKKFRSGAWLFAIGMATQPDGTRETRTNHMSWTAALGAWYLHPPGRTWTLFPALVYLLGKGERRDVAANLCALNRIADRPADVTPAFRRTLS